MKSQLIFTTPLRPDLKKCHPELAKDLAQSASPLEVDSNRVSVVRRLGLMKYGLILTTTAILFIMITAASHAATIYVDAANKGAADGSQAKPFNTIQKGIDAAQSGDTVQVAAGTYKEVNIQLLKDGITLQGAGAEVTKITSTDPAQAFILVLNAKSGAISGFTLDGSGTIADGFDLNRSDITIKNNVFTNLSENGLVAWSSKPTISNNQFVKNRNMGIRLKRSDAIVTDNVIKENPRGIFCEDRTNATIANNEIALNQAHGIELSGFSAPTLRNNRITGNGWRGIYARSASATIEGNTISGNAGNGIDGDSDLNILANEIRANRGAGIWLIGNSGGSVRGNTIADNGDDGIYTQSSSSTLVIAENTITGNGGSGIECINGSPTIERNTVTDNTQAGILCGGAAKPTIANNTLSSNREDGIRLGWSTETGATIMGNQIIGNAKNGILISSTNHGAIIIAGNKISDNAIDGVQTNSVGQIISTGIQIRDNQITDNGGVGIRNWDGRAQIRGNLITGNAERGIYIGHEGTIPDLGTDADPGNNAIYGNGNPEQLWNDTPHNIQAIGNYWGKGTAEGGPKDLILTNAGGSVFFGPWLTVEPPLPIVPGGVLLFTWPTRRETGSGPFEIAWRDNNPGSGTLSLYYDTDRGGHDGTAIPGAANIPLSDPKNQYVWAPSGLPIGATYYLYAELNDGAGNLSYVYSTGSMTLGGSGTTRGTFTRQLVKGLNLISLPLRPDTPFTAQSLIDKLNATVLTKLDENRQTFVPYLPGISLDFPIEGGAGYIINVTQAKSVTFTGTVWDNTTAAAPPSLVGKGAGGLGTVWAFVVGGELRSNDFSRSPLTVRNLRTGEILRYTQNDTESYAVVFADLNRRSVVEAGDVLEVGIDGINGGARYTVTDEDLRRAFARIDLSPSDGVPAHTRLLQNYPNPFNPETWIPYHLAEAADVTLSIYDATGKPIRTLPLGQQAAGFYTKPSQAAHWDGRNQWGESVASGVYFYRLAAGNFTATRRMVILK
ncbi:right-handed parallel beta-helix repeat-containing protein [Candidatus Poribacteria bacterium]|nr:right-handed parallel beta-helix repeat-containing protein [Candidatus Poribacteria bacterium]